MPEEESKPEHGGHHWFATTHWSVVLAAGQTNSPEMEAALEALCKSYWFPIYSYIRRRGHEHQNALDLAQGFFEMLLEKKNLAGIDPHRGRFRSFLLTVLNGYLANQYDRETAQKRGGGKKIISLDDDTIENRYQLEPATNLTPDKIYERHWAVAVMQKALDDLAAEFSSAGKTRLFEALKIYLTTEPSAGDYKIIAQQLNMKEGGIAVSVYRMRQRYRELVRGVVANTVSNPMEIDDEMRHLLELLQAG
jgi:RNA polymerase sigma factor (sigma-70 family)